jgi:colicin import membrane protein
MPPQKSQKSLTRGRWRAVALSILLHSAIVAAAVYGWFTWKHRPPEPEVLAIEANLVDERQLKGLKPIPETPQETPAPPPPEAVPEPEPAPPPVEEQGPPKPDPAEIERKKEEERLEQEKLEQQKIEQQKQAQQLKEREDAERLEAEKQAAARAAADQAAAAKTAADEKALEKKRVEDAAAAKKAADEKARLAREAELRRSLEAEERGNRIRNSDDAARWHAQIVARITRAWIRPPSARAGIECIVSVTQVPGGEVTGVRVDSCSGGDAALRESVEAAVYRASPLPSPPDPALFERNLELTFAPNE